MRLAVDVMGGDHGPAVVVRGALQALELAEAIRELILVGKEDAIRPLIASSSAASRVRVVHASDVVTMEDGPMDVLRRKKDSSMARAIDLVASHEADAILSCGNTGGLLAASTIKLRRLRGMDRPAIATVIPTPENEFVLLDAGANVESKPIHLVHYAIMGSIYSSEVLGYSRPVLAC
jgi:phosphate acyltransferase